VGQPATGRDQPLGSTAAYDRSALPKRMTRRRAAEFLRQEYFETSPRTLERAPIPWALLNGQAHCLTADLIKWAESVVAAAPMAMGGHRSEIKCNAEETFESAAPHLDTAAVVRRARCLTQEQQSA
jgi:hypothetical protein